MRIQADGHVGIGTSDPDTLLELRKDTASGAYGEYPTLSLRNDNAAGYSAIHFQEGSTQRARVEVGNNSGTPYMGLYTTSAASGIMIKDGKVGIGTTNPLTALHVGTTGGNAYSSTITKSSNMEGGIFTQASNGDDMVGVYFATGSTTEGTHWSGITGSRSANTTHWGTQLNFYTHNNDVANLNDATQKMVIKGDGKVGIGITAPAHKLDVQHTIASGGSDAIANFGTSGSGAWANSGHQVVIGGPSVLTYTGLIIHSDSTSGNGAVSFADGRGASDSWRGSVNYNHGNDSMAFATNAVTRMTIDSSGDVSIPYLCHAYGTLSGNNTGAGTGWPLVVASSTNMTYQNNASHGWGLTILKAGYYHMHATGLYQPNGSVQYVYIGWAVNGGIIHHWHSNHTIESNHDFVSSIGKYLNIGDHLTIENNVSIGTNWGSTHSAFHVFKIG
jgi:hypothetical protein